MFRRPLVAPLDEGADGRWRGVEDADAILFDEVPETVLTWMIGRSLVHHRRRAVGERAIDDVAVPRHPADVGGAPVGILLLQIENVTMRECRPQEIAGRRVQDAFWLSRRSAGVKNEKRVLAVELLSGTIGGRLGHQLMPP